MRKLILVLALASFACSIPMALPSGSIQTDVKQKSVLVAVAAPLPPTTAMTVLGSLRLRDAPDNTGSRTLAVIPQGETFHVQRRTTVSSTDWAYGSWYNGKEWITGWVAARFLR
jgi:hypothetical protein